VHDEGARAAQPGPLRAVELVHVRLPLVRAFRTASGTTSHKEAVLVRAVTDGAEGWGECATAAPPYPAATIEESWEALRSELVPRALGGVVAGTAAKGRFAHAALEAARLDAQLRTVGVSLAAYLGGVRPDIEAGVAIGIVDDVTTLCALAAGYVAGGYRRIKVKIEPGHDVEPATRVRAAIGDTVALAVDGNGSYTAEDAPVLQGLDRLALQCIEQPLAADAIGEHAQLARALETPIALDESITNAKAARAAITGGACRAVNIKAGRAGGLAEARRIHDVCRELGTPALIGGMLATGIGRAVDVALASLPAFTLTGDCSASDRYFAEDVTDPFVLRDGRIRVPDGPGIGVEVRRDVIDGHAVRRELLRT
jgi:O-succinylbenzoate synthase